MTVSSAEVAEAESVTVAGPISDVPLFGAAVIVTVGAGSCVTESATAEEVVVRPLASFATAVTDKLPAGGFFQATLYGTADDEPIFVVPA
jgi:hypothetical protein